MLSWEEILLRLVLATIFGGVIGIERERKDWSAGMRTHMMVCVGASLCMMVSSFGFMDMIGHDNVQLDPSRVAGDVISGIGFLGAGTILFLKPATIKGLTTASGLWTIAGIGLATGGGMYFAATAATVIAVIILWAVQIVQKKLQLRYTTKSLHIAIRDKDQTQAVIDRLMAMEHAEFSNLAIHNSGKNPSIDVVFLTAEKKEIMAVFRELQALPFVKQISWT
jgi:putative Mg2+ transporter-C (MgtC) family protein